MFDRMLRIKHVISVTSSTELSLKWHKRSNNFDKRPNRRQKNSLMKKFALRENRTANALPLCIADRGRATTTMGVWRGRSAVCRATTTTTTMTTSVSSLPRPSVGHAWVHTGDEFVRWAGQLDVQCHKAKSPKTIWPKRQHFNCVINTIKSNHFPVIKIMVESSRTTSINW